MKRSVTLVGVIAWIASSCTYQTCPTYSAINKEKSFPSNASVSSALSAKAPVHHTSTAISR